MKSTIKLMFAALFASAAHFSITEDSAGGAVAAESAAPVAQEPTLTDKINQFFESSDKRHLQEALLMIAAEIDAVKIHLADAVKTCAEFAGSGAEGLENRLAAIEDFTGIAKQ